MLFTSLLMMNYKVFT